MRTRQDGGYVGAGMDNGRLGAGGRMIYQHGPPRRHRHGIAASGRTMERNPGRSGESLITLTLPAGQAGSISGYGKER